MALGGAVSLSDRRLRFGLPQRGRAAWRWSRPNEAELAPRWPPWRRSSCLARGRPIRPTGWPIPAKEARARALFEQIRCVVCQNKSIDDSEADLARDLRQTVRGQIATGRSDDQIRRFLVQRYGEFILLTPALSAGQRRRVAGALRDRPGRRRGAAGPRRRPRRRRAASA